jgi:hypothetical protein
MGPNQTFILLAPFFFPPGLRWTEREFDQEPPSSAKAKMSGAIYLIPPYAFVVWTATFLPNTIREEEVDGTRDRLKTGTNIYLRDP